MIFLSYLGMIVICLLLEGFFAGTEMAVISSNKLKIRFLAKKGNHSAQQVKKFLAKPQLFLATTLVGANLAVITSSSIASRMMSLLVPSELVQIVTTCIMLPLILFFGELIPMSIGRLHATRLSITTVSPLRIAYYILFPLVKLFSVLSEKILTVCGVSLTKKNPFLTRDELLYILEHEAEREILSKYDAGIIKKIFHFQNVVVENVMVPIDKVVMISSETSCTEVVKLMQESGFSRIPVYDVSRTNLTGIIRTSELLNADLNKPVKRYVIKPLYVNHLTPVIRVLWDLQMNGRQMVVVQDSHKKTVGILTMEDIMEKVVGSIIDEYDIRELSSQ
jgi:CBS domain containing-hemolysin-like protein